MPTQRLLAVQITVNDSQITVNDTKITVNDTKITIKSPSQRS
jgi:hypothetical protein